MSERRPQPDSFWGRLRATVLYDYPPTAARLWVVFVALGFAGAIWVAKRLLESPESIFPCLLGAAAVAVAAAFPIHIPGAIRAAGAATAGVSAADAFIFAILALLGPPAAVIAAGSDATINAIRVSKRLSSRVVSPAIAMAAMVVAGMAFEFAREAAARFGLHEQVATFVALCVAALVQYALVTAPINVVMYLKRGQSMRWSDWFTGTGWVAGLSLLSAIVAGLVVEQNRTFGLAGVGIIGAAVLVAILLLHVTYRRSEAERKIQEQRIAEAEREAVLNQKRFAAAFAYAAGGMAVVSREGKCLRVNRALCDLLRRPEADLIGNAFEAVLSDNEVEAFRDQIRGLLAEPDVTIATEVRCRTESGEIWVALQCSHFEDPADIGACLIYQASDITARHLAEAQLEHLAYHDSLTQLPNRAEFQKRLDAALIRSAGAPDKDFAVLFLNLDRFKMVNDSFGHAAGNMLLIEVANRLRKCVRPGDTVARLGGDEFALLLDRVGEVDTASWHAHSILETLSQPIAVLGTEVSVQASIGVTVSDLERRSTSEMMRDADTAMNEAKSAKHGGVAVYDTSMHQYIAERVRMESELRRSIELGQISLVYQPIFDLASSRLTGFEALVRWVHPVFGPVDTQKFIELAEECGFITVLTPWVVETAVAQLAAWKRLVPELGDLQMHVNVTGRDLALRSFPSRVRASLSRSGLQGHQLSLEITETGLMHSLSNVAQVMEGLRVDGVHFCIDDFGTGYSSLAYLSKLPVDTLKIDRSFIDQMQFGTHNIEIVRAVQTLGVACRKKVIAEGVETVQQLTILREIGVDCGQGYLLGRPMRQEQVKLLPFQLDVIPA